MYLHLVFKNHQIIGLIELKVQNSVIAVSIWANWPLLGNIAIAVRLSSSVDFLIQNDHLPSKEGESPNIVKSNQIKLLQMLHLNYIGCDKKAI